LTPLDEPTVAALVVRAIKTALGPLKERLLTLEARAALDVPIREDLTAVRERLAVLETRAPVPGPAGADGEPGADGLGFDDLTFAHDGERGFVLRFIKGAVVKEFPFTIAGVPIYRATYTAGHSYSAGDVVTYGNQAWIAKTTTFSKPGDGGSDWHLAVRKGADGKDGKPGERGPAGPAGSSWEETYEARHGRKG